MRKVYVACTALLFAAVVLQFYFAAFGVFTQPENDSQFILHSINGTGVIPLLSIVATIFAALAKAPGKLIGLTILPLGLIVVQISLFILAGATGSSEEKTNAAGQAVLGLHAVNGLAILLVAFLVFRRARAHATAATSTPAPAQEVSVP
jgi:Family of unknown function (DUF6220)